MGSKHKGTPKTVNKPTGEQPASSPDAAKCQKDDIKSGSASQPKLTFEGRLKSAMETHFKSVKALQHAHVDLLDEEKPTPEYTMVDKECTKQWDNVLNLTKYWTAVDEAQFERLIKDYPSWYRRGVTRNRHFAIMDVVFARMFL